MYGYFPQELFHLLALTHPARLFSPTVSAGCLPRPIPVAAGAVTRLSPRLRYCSAVRLLTKPRTISLALIGPRSPVPPGDSASPPEVTHCSSVPCHPQTPWCGGWMRTPSPLQCRLDLAPPWADRFIVGVAPIDYGPVLLLLPFGFHLAMDTLPSGFSASGGSRSALAVSSFRLRARLGVSIPSCSLRPARHYPAFGYDTPHPSIGGTLTLPNNALLSAHCGTVRLPGSVHRRRASLDFPTRPAAPSATVSADAKCHLNADEECQLNAEAGCPS
jgi:hypothetical protein